MYIISYISKAERELGTLIKAAQNEARQLGNDDAMKELRTLGQVYITHREVRLFPPETIVNNLLLYSCQIETTLIVFCPGFHHGSSVPSIWPEPETLYPKCHIHPNRRQLHKVVKNIRYLKNRSSQFRNITSYIATFTPRMYKLG